MVMRSQFVEQKIRESNNVETFPNFYIVNPANSFNVKVDKMTSLGFCFLNANQSLFVYNIIA